MLNDSPVSAVLPSKDLEMSKDFYQNKLGLKLTDMPMEDPLMFGAGQGTVLVVYKRAEGNQAEHTQAGFNVKDIDGLMKELASKGVKFEDYDMPGFDKATHTMSYGAVKSAWFKDPDGNILALNQM